MVTEPLFSFFTRCDKGYLTWTYMRELIDEWTKVTQGEMALPFFAKCSTETIVKGKKLSSLTFIFQRLCSASKGYFTRITLMRAISTLIYSELWRLLPSREEIEVGKMGKLISMSALVQYFFTFSALDSLTAKHTPKLKLWVSWKFREEKSFPFSILINIFLKTDDGRTKFVFN